MFEDQSDCCQTIAKYMDEAVSRPWSDVRIDVKLDGEAIYLVSSYQPRDSIGKREECLVDDFVAECFYQLARLVSTPEKGLFKECVFILKSDGKYNADFVY